MLETRRRPALVLIASDGEWFARSLESVLDFHAYDVDRCAAGTAAIDACRDVRPDAIVLDDSPSDMPAVAVCRALRADPAFDPATPIIVTSPAPSAHWVRVEAFEAGAWDFCTQPLDVETLLPKIATFIRARRESAIAQALIDGRTGIYTAIGMEQLASKLGARASRKSEAFACLAIMPDEAADETALPDDSSRVAAMARAADVCSAQSRRSDVVGFLAPSRLAILAPETDAQGAQRLIARLRSAWAAAGSGGPKRASTMRVGYCAVTNFAASALNPRELMRRAEVALQHAVGSQFHERAFSFDELSMN